jgi:hypothetical protein
MARASMAEAPTSHATQELQRAHAAERVSADAYATQKAATFDLKRRAGQNKLKCDRARVAVDAKLVSAAAGSGEAPDTIADTAALAELEAFDRGYELAIRQGEAAEHMLLAEHDRTGAAVRDAAFGLIQSDKSEAARNAQATLASIRDSLLEDCARLIAIEEAQKQVLGRGFQFSGGPNVSVFNGAMVAEAFLNSIPARVRPDGLTLDAARTKAARMTTEIVQLLRGH